MGGVASGQVLVLLDLLEILVTEKAISSFRRSYVLVLNKTKKNAIICGKILFAWYARVSSFVHIICVCCIIYHFLSFAPIVHSFALDYVIRSHAHRQ